MKVYSGKPYNKTSVSLRQKSYRRFRAAWKILSRNRVFLSEQDLFRRLLRIYLISWRGRGTKARTARRYNLKRQHYVRRPAYFRHDLYAALWERGLHSGESISRMLDFAIRHYLPQLIESLLAQNPLSVYETRNSPYWRERHCSRYDKKRAIPTGFITYDSQTAGSSGANLEWIQKSTFHPLSYKPIPVNSPRSPHFYLGLGR